MLRVAGCEAVTDAGLLPFGRQTSSSQTAAACALVEIDLSRCPLVTDAGLIHLASVAPCLRRVAVAWCRRIGDASLAAVSAGATGVDGGGGDHGKDEPAPGYALDFSGTAVGDGAVARAVGCLGHLLQEIRLCAAAGVGPLALVALAKHCAGGSLAVLGLDGCDGLPVARLGALGKALDGLVDLGLGGLVLSDSSLRGFLHASNGSLAHLCLADCTGVTDAALAAIASCSQLVSLDLSRTPVSTASLAAILAGCPLLSSLTVHGCANVSLNLLKQADHGTKVDVFCDHRLGIV